MFILNVFNNAVTLTAFVAVMMILVEYLNIFTRGKWGKEILGSRWKKYFISVILGAIPGCLGGFILITLFSHRMISLGAVLAGMIATTGDESFVMLARFQLTAVFLFFGLSILGILTGFIFDLFKKEPVSREECEFDIHIEDEIISFSPSQFINQWKPPIPQRGIITIAIILFIIGLITHEIGEETWDFQQITLLLISICGLFIVSMVPDHFLEEHLWRHISLKHVPRIFLWTFGCLLILNVIQHFLPVESFVQENKFFFLIFAGIVGIIPESGPHLLFVIMFADGKIPLSVLVANAIVQDGHGMLPMLAYSGRDFIKIKTIKFFMGLLIGLLLMWMGW